MGVHETAGDQNGLVSEFFIEVRWHCGESGSATDQVRNRLKSLWQIVAPRPEEGVADAAAYDHDKPGYGDPKNNSGRPEPTGPPHARLDLRKNRFRKSEVAHLDNMTHHLRLAYPASPPGGLLLGDYPHRATMNAPTMGRSSSEHRQTA